MNFENKVILITGASTGIGKELVIALSKINCKLVLVARRIKLIDDLVEELSSKAKAEFLPIKCDVSIKEEVLEAFNQIINNRCSLNWS